MSIKEILPKLHMEIEHWKYYMPMDVYVSSFGRFKDKNGNILPPTAKNNYLMFRGELVHRLVMTIFKPVPGCAGMTVDHLDHNTRNNKLSNLEWVSLEENRARARRDAQDNERTMLQRNMDAFEQYKDELAKFSQPNDVVVKLNGSIMPIDIAESIIKGSKDLKNSKVKLDKLFLSIRQGVNSTTEFTVGNFSLEIMKGE